MLRAVLIDDEPKGLEALGLLLQRYVPDIRVVAEASSPHAAVTLIENYKPEIVFLDINMPGMNGFELLEELSWKEFSLVFTTAHQEYGLRALKNQAVDYLLKPIDHQELSLAVERIKTQLANRKKNLAANYEDLLKDIPKQGRQKIIVNTKTGVESLDVQNIIYVESRSNCVRISLCDGRNVTVSRTLKEFESLLCGDDLDFIRVHNSFIIQFRKAVKFLKPEKMIVMSNNQTVPLAKSRQDMFFKLLGI